MSAGMSVSAVVVAFRSATHLPGLLADLNAQGVEEVIVVDNASPDDSAAVAVAVLPRAQILRLEVNRGFAAGANVGVAAASGTHLLLVNPDVRLAPGAVGALRSAAGRRPEAVLGPRVRDTAGRVLPTRRSLPGWWSLLGEEVLLREGAAIGGWPQRRWARWAGYDREVDAPILSGVCLLVPRAVWEHTGPLDEGYFLYWEEVDWQLRARALGYPTVLVPAAEVVHARSASLGLHDPRRARLMGRATTRFLDRHAPTGQRLGWRGLLSLGQVLRWVAWAARGLRTGRAEQGRAAQRRAQHGAWLRGAWSDDAPSSDAPSAAAPRSGGTWWMVEPFGLGGVAQYAADVGGLLAPAARVRLAVATGGPAPGAAQPWERWFPRLGPAPLDRGIAAAVGLVRAGTRPRRGDTAWVALGFRPRYERALVAALRRAGCRVVATVHNRHPHEAGADPARSAAAVAAAARRCDAVVVHTADMVAWASAAGLPVVRLPFPPPAIEQGRPDGVHRRSSLGLADDDIVVAVIGNLRGYKGVDVLLEAVGLLPADSRVRVVLAGQAQGWDVLGAAASAGARDRVTLLEGYLPHGELLDVLTLADVVALPYRQIDHSGVGALAAALGVPAVASDLPGLRELFGDAARYVPPGDAPALAAALEGLPAHLPLLRRAAAAADRPTSPGQDYPRFVARLDGTAAG